MKAHFIYFNIIVSTLLSGCATPYIVKNITETVQEGKRLENIENEKRLSASKHDEEAEINAEK